MSPQAHIEASGDDGSTQIMKELAFSAHTAAAPIDHQSLQSISNVYGALPACIGARLEAPNASTNALEASVRSTSTDTSLTVNAVGCASTRKMLYEDPQILC